MSLSQLGPNGRIKHVEDMHGILIPPQLYEAKWHYEGDPNCRLCSYTTERATRHRLHIRHGKYYLTCFRFGEPTYLDIKLMRFGDELIPLDIILTHYRRHARLCIEQLRRERTEFFERRRHKAATTKDSGTSPANQHPPYEQNTFRRFITWCRSKAVDAPGAKSAK